VRTPKYAGAFLLAPPRQTGATADASVPRALGGTVEQHAHIYTQGYTQTHIHTRMLSRA